MKLGMWFLILIFLVPSEVLAVTDCAQVTQVPRDECNVLLTLYNNTNGPGWRNKVGWNETNAPCSWRGVVCIGGHVNWLILNGNWLSGLIPAELGNLTDLQFLILTSNQLKGLIPVELGKLSNLQYLSLNINQLDGLIPAELGRLSSLRELDLSANQLTGSIPAELGNLSNLQELLLGGNQLSGLIPAELGNLSNLRGLVLSDSQLSGSIPPELGNLTNLQGLYLDYNQLSGSIPPELGNLTNLQELYLDYNQLSGLIPTELGNLSNLQLLFLYNNQLCGDIPLSLINLNKLLGLNLENNGLDIIDLKPELKAFFDSLSYAVWKSQNPYICSASLATLASFETIPNSTGILLKWQTLIEDKNAGYFIWRGQPNNSQCTSNPENYHDIVLIGFEASKSNGFSGTTYLYQDHTVKPKTTYCYLLEDRNFGGNSTFHWDSIVSVTTD